MLVTQLEFLDDYNPTVRSLDERLLMVAPSKPADEPRVGQLKIVQSHSLKDAVEKTTQDKNQEKKKFTLIHSSVDAIAPVDRRKQFHQLDQSISRIFEQSVSANGLMIVILAGTTPTTTSKSIVQTGLCLVRVNQQPID